MQASDRACFSGELRVERITASSLPRIAGHVSPYVRIVYVRPVVDALFTVVTLTLARLKMPKGASDRGALSHHHRCFGPCNLVSQGLARWWLHRVRVCPVRVARPVL